MPRINPRDVYAGYPPTSDYQPRKPDVIALHEQHQAEIDQVREIAFDEARVFPDTSAGLAGTEEGQQFRVASADPDIAFLVYRHDSGPAATLIATTPSVEALGDKASASDVDASTARLSGAGVLQLEHADFDDNGRIRLSEEQLQYRVIAFPPVIEDDRRVIVVPEAGWSGLVIAPKSIINTTARVRRREETNPINSSEADALPTTYHMSEGERALLYVDDSGATRRQASDPDRPGFAFYVAGRDPAALDDFRRAWPIPAQSLGLGVSGFRWHNSGNWRIHDGAASVRPGAASGRVYARTGFPFRDYAAQVIADVPALFNIGWTFRSPNNETGTNPRLYVRAFVSANFAGLRLNYETSGSNDSSSGQIAEVRVPSLEAGRHEFGFVQRGRTIMAFIDGQEVLRHTISEAQHAALGYNCGLNVSEDPDDPSRITRVAVWPLVGRASGDPRVISHRGVIRAPFGSGNWDGRDPENCLSALERLPLGLGVEVDIRATSDGDFVLMHDSTVDRTTTGSGAVSTMTTEAVTGLTIRGVGGRTVPTFQSFLRALEDRPDVSEVLVHYNSGGVAAALAELAQAEASVYDRCLFFVNSLADAVTVRSLDANVRIAVGSRTNANEAELGDLHAAGVELCLIAPGDNSTANNIAQIAAIQGAGMRAYASTTQWHWTVRNLIDAGADGFLADYPVWFGGYPPLT